IVVQSVVNSFGFLFVAGFTATNKLYGLLEVAAISFGYAITTFNSQNLGAKQYERMKHGVFQANLLSLTTSLIISIMMLIFGKSILLLFISGSVHQIEVVLSIAFRYLSIMAICLPILYVLHTYRSALQGMENTFIPMLSGIVELIMRIGIALFLPLFIGQDGIYYAEVFAWSGAAILLYISYRVKIKAYFK
ncbi:MAG: MATE family efflux transporter, partial [Longibaculum sp.]